MVKSRDETSQIKLPRIYVRRQLHLNATLETTEEEARQWPHLKDLPVHYGRSEEVSLLIGQDCPDALVPHTTVPGGRGEPFAVRTDFGWTVSGPVTQLQSGRQQRSVEKSVGGVAATAIKEQGEVPPASGGEKQGKRGRRRGGQKTRKVGVSAQRHPSCPYRLQPGRGQPLGPVKAQYGTVIKQSD